MTTWRRGTAIALTIVVGWAVPSVAQRISQPLFASADSAPTAVPAPVGLPATGYQPYVVRWWEAAAVVGGAGLILSDDRHLLHDTREHPGRTYDDLADAFRQVGNAKVYSALSVGLLGAGLIAGNRGITRTGGQLAASGLLAATTFGLLKVVGGRSRPDAGDGPYDFHPFSGGSSFSSGHSALAFALATTLGDASHNTLARIGLYAVATGTAWSRVYNERHWPSDVFLGAAIGLTSAKFINGRWRIFGLRSPRFLASPSGVGLQASF